MNSKSKIFSINKLKSVIDKERKSGKKIAFTNGCFDILHMGHVSYLEKAKKAGRILVVALNSDRSVKEIKGPDRPVNSQTARAAVIAALACVDYVTIFDDATPLKVIENFKPDVLIKGADWKGKTVVGSDVVKSYGGKTEFIPYIDAYSTTKIIQSINKQCAS